MLNILYICIDIPTPHTHTHTHTHIYIYIYIYVYILYIYILYIYILYLSYILALYVYVFWWNVANYILAARHLFKIKISHVSHVWHGTAKVHKKSNIFRLFSLTFFNGERINIGYCPITHDWKLLLKLFL